MCRCGDVSMLRCVDVKMCVIEIWRCGCVYVEICRCGDVDLGKWRCGCVHV